MTKSKKLSTVIALCAASAVCVAAGGVLLNHAVAYAEDYTIVDKVGDRLAYGAGWGEEASAKVVAAFKEKDIDAENITLYTKDSLKDGQLVDKGQVVVFAAEAEGSAFIYNVLNDAVYEVAGNFAVENLDKQIRNIGAPVMDVATDVTVNGYDGDKGAEVKVTSGTKVQLFETGLIVEKDGEAEVHTGVIEKTGDKAYTIHPLINDQDVLATGKGTKITANDKELGFIGSIDGTWHALKTARTSRSGNTLTVYYNFRAGCVEVKYDRDWKLTSRIAYAGQNYNANNERVNLPVENYTDDEHLWTEVKPEAVNMYKSLTGNPNATEEQLKQLFREGYLNMVENEGIIPGYRCSELKTWSFIVIDYKYSPDSNRGFDETGKDEGTGRERMFTLVYSSVKNAVYGVGDDFFIAWKEDSIRPQLGAPMSNVMEDVTISGTHFDRIQIFETGYIYSNNGSALITETGTTTDPDYKNFIVKPAPAAPSEYGEQVGNSVEKTENGRQVIYYNYQKGAAKATEMATKTGYIYKYYPGRNFNFEGNGPYTTTLLPYDRLYSEAMFTFESVPNGTSWLGVYNEDGTEYVDSLRDMVIAKVKALLNKGFFPGFPDGDFRTWNNVYGTQFIYGDSSATPHGGDARTNVCAIMYNEELKDVFLVKDAYMDAWGTNDNNHNAWRILGAPVSDEFTLPSNPNVIFQYYAGAAYRNNKAFAVTTGYNEATWFTPSDTPSDKEIATPEQYLVSLGELSRPLTRVKLTVGLAELTSNDGWAELSWEIVGAWADATVTFTSSNEDIAVVYDDGYVEFYAKGKVTITITVSDGVRTIKDSYTFNIKK